VVASHPPRTQSGVPAQSERIFDRAMQSSSDINAGLSVAEQAEMKRIKEREDEARREANRQRTKAKHEQERVELEMHLQKVDERLKNASMRKEARRQHMWETRWENASGTSPRPKPRPMVMDIPIRENAYVPGPGAFSPRRPVDGDGALRHVTGSEFGTTFAKTPFSKTTTWDKGAGAQDRWQVKDAVDQPGPCEYRPDGPGVHRPRTDNQTGLQYTGTTFGLAPELRHGPPDSVPPAHDMSRMVEYLKGVPAPDAYEPLAHATRGGKERNMAFKILPKPDQELTTLEHLMRESAKVPGPGAYEDPYANNSVHASKGVSAPLSSTFTDMNPHSLTSSMDRGSKLPAPDAYHVIGVNESGKPTLRSAGSPRFFKPKGRGGLSLIETIQAHAKQLPGPGAYHQTPTFQQELEQQRYLRKAAKGVVHVPPEPMRGSTPRGRAGDARNSRSSSPRHTPTH